MTPLHLEVIYAGDQNLCCFYMAEVVKSVASVFENELEWSIIEIFKEEGSRRFYDLSVALYGEENVRKHHRHAPVPSIFIDGKLAFSQIPPVEELEEYLRLLIEKRRQEQEI